MERIITLYMMTFPTLTYKEAKDFHQKHMAEMAEFVHIKKTSKEDS